MATANRRERYRTETREETKRLALRQLAQAGPWALSLNAIARDMGVTGPALYRYFAGRDDLVTELVVDAFDDLADVMDDALTSPRTGPSPQARVRAVAGAYRQWALSQPHRYRLLFATPGRSGLSGTAASAAPEGRVAAAARRALATLAAAMVPGGTAREHGAREPVRVTSPAGRLALAAWTRMHGVVGLEIEGHLRAVGVDPSDAFEAEVDTVLDALDSLGRGR